MEPLLATFLDRELLVSAVCHDVRGPLTAIDGFAELDGVHVRSQVRQGVVRLNQMLSVLPARPVADRDEDLADFFAVPSARAMTAGLRLLQEALGDLPYGVLELVQSETTVELLISDLDAAELGVDWNVAVIRRWEAGDPFGKRGARVRMAARLAAASRVRFEPGQDPARGVLGIAFVRPLA